MNRWMPGSVVNFNGAIDILQRSAGFHYGHVDYYISTQRIKSRPQNSVIIAHNNGLVFI